MALDALPKVELHCHIEGAMRPSTVVELARSNGIPLPTEDPTELYRYDSLNGFLDVFWLVQSTLCTRADWTRLAYEAVLDSAAHGVLHQECFFTPARHIVAGPLGSGSREPNHDGGPAPVQYVKVDPHTPSRCSTTAPGSSGSCTPGSAAIWVGAGSSATRWRRPSATRAGWAASNYAPLSPLRLAGDKFCPDCAEDLDTPSGG